MFDAIFRRLLSRAFQVVYTHAKQHLKVFHLPGASLLTIHTSTQQFWTFTCPLVELISYFIVFLFFVLFHVSFRFIFFLDTHVFKHDFVSGYANAQTYKAAPTVLIIVR